MSDIKKCWCGADADDGPYCTKHGTENRLDLEDWCEFMKRTDDNKERTEGEIIGEFRYVQGRIEEIMTQRRLLKERLRNLDERGRRLAKEFNARMEELGAHVIPVKK